MRKSFFWRGCFLGLSVLCVGATFGFVRSVSATDQPIIPASALHVFDSPSTGTVWNYLSNLYMTVPWKNPGGDWSDLNGTLQGNVPWATASITNLGAEQTISFNITSLVQDQLSDSASVPNRGWIIKNDSGGVSEFFYSREYSDPTKRPGLHIVTSMSTYDLVPSGDVGITSSTQVSDHGTDSTMVVDGSAGRVAIYFDLSSVSGSVTSATLTLKTNATQFGGGTSTLGLYPVDLAATFASIPEESGIAADYTNDAGIEGDPNVIFTERFPDLNMEERGWWYAYFPTTERSVVGDTDPDDSNYEPLVPGMKAYKMTIPTGQYGGEFGRWSFWSNLGYEPNEVYMRVYARIGTDFDSEGGKFPFGFDGTYLVRNNLNLLNPTRTISANPVTGRPWIRPDAPAYAGNGGATSNGTNGWSFRGGFMAEDCPSGSTDCADRSPLVDAGYRALTYYSYWADQPDYKGSEFDWSNGLLGIIPKNRWVAIDQHIKLNTVNPDGTGNHDGILEAWVDGRLAYSTNTIRERNWPGNAAGANNIKIDSVWLNLYHGGLDAAKSPMTVYLSDIVVANSFIGPTVLSGSVQPDTTDPVVSVSAPSSGGTVSGSSVTLSASASDNISVTGVRFYVDGNPIGNEDTASPFSITWDSTSVADGTHSVTALARDGAGNTALSAAQSFIVSQSSTPDPTPGSTPVTQTKKSSSHKSSSQKKKTVKSFTLSQSAPSVSRGTLFTQRGKKFSKNSTVQVFFETRPGSFGKQILRTDAKGNFSTSFRVNKPAGTYRWYAVDIRTGKTSSSRWYTVR